MKRAFFILSLVMVSLSALATPTGCARQTSLGPSPYEPHCDDPGWERAAAGVFTLGLSELYRTTLECAPYANESKEGLRRRGAELDIDSDPKEQFKVGYALSYRGESELGYRLICFSAHQRYQDAEFWMARRYNFGFPPLERDLVQAYKWYQLTYSGAEYADKKHTDLTPKMTAAQLSEAKRLVAEWEANPAECEDIGAQIQN